MLMSSPPPPILLAEKPAEERVFEDIDVFFDFFVEIYDSKYVVDKYIDYLKTRAPNCEEIRDILTSYYKLFLKGALHDYFLTKLRKEAQELFSLYTNEDNLRNVDFFIFRCWDTLNKHDLTDDFLFNFL